MASPNIENVIKTMVYEKLNQKEATEKVGITESHFSRWKKNNAEEHKELKAKYERAFLSDLVSPALQTLRELLSSENDNVRLNAVRDILDRTGHKPIDKQEVAHSGDMTVNNPFKDLSTEELRKLASLGDE